MLSRLSMARIGAREQFVPDGGPVKHISYFSHPDLGLNKINTNKNYLF